MARPVNFRSLGRVPGLRRLPIAVLISAAEVAVLAREHALRLTPEERRRLVELIRLGRGRPTNLSASQRRELEALVRKLEPRLFVGEAVAKLSPVRLPRRAVTGRRRSGR